MKKSSKVKIVSESTIFEFVKMKITTSKSVSLLQEIYKIMEIHRKKKLLLESPELI